MNRIDAIVRVTWDCPSCEIQNESFVLLKTLIEAVKTSRKNAFLYFQCEECEKVFQMEEIL